MNQFEYEGHACSLLPEGKQWKLVWNDEFDGTELDRSKWDYRLYFWGRRLNTFMDGGVELDGESHMKMPLLKIGDDYYSAQLQTGAISYDKPKDTERFWPLAKLDQPKFMHRYGYYEIRCKLPKNAGWHAAFWLQAPGIGSHPDARFGGVECDIMENYPQHLDGHIIGGNIWGGYGRDCQASKHFHWKFEETADGWHYYGVDWNPDGYWFYADGRLIGRVLSPEHMAEKDIRLTEDGKWLEEGSTAIGPVSQVEQFVLVTTEAHGYRGPGFMVPPDHKFGTPAPILAKAVLPDYFVVDHVRVFDEVTAP